MRLRARDFAGALHFHRICAWAVFVVSLKKMRSREAIFGFAGTLINYE